MKLERTKLSHQEHTNKKGKSQTACGNAKIVGNSMAWETSLSKGERVFVLVILFDSMEESIGTETDEDDDDVDVEEKEEEEDDKKENKDVSCLDSFNVEEAEEEGKEEETFSRGGGGGVGGM